MANNFSATFNSFNTNLNRILKDIVPITIGNGSYKNGYMTKIIMIYFTMENGSR